MSRSKFLAGRHQNNQRKRGKRFVRVQSVALAALSLGLLLAPSMSAQELRLDIAPIPLDNNSKVEFRAVPIDSELPTVNENIGSTKHCEIFAGPDIAHYDSDLRLFKYDIFVKDSFANQPHWSHFEVKAVPTGPFLDQVRDLDVSVTVGSNVERGEIRLPLHSLSNDQYLSAVPTANPLDIRLGSDQHIRIELTNKLKDMKLVVQSAQLSYVDASFWVGGPPQLTSHLVLAEQGSATLDGFSVRASPGKAIPTTFFRLKNGDDTQLNLVITYSAQSGGKVKESPLLIKVRFVPSLPYLAFMLFLGAFVGSVARFVGQRRRITVRGWLRSFGSAVAGAVIVELIGVVLVSLNSEFKLFGIVLDPFQIPQVILMAVLIGLLGVNIANSAQEIIGMKPNRTGIHSASSGGDF